MSDAIRIREVDTFEMTTLVDNTVDMLLESTENVRRPKRPKEIPPTPLLAEHGFAATVRIAVDGESHTILLDAGLGHETTLLNADLLGIDLSEAEAIVISHGHIDHIRALMNIMKRMRPGTPLVIHPHAFRPRILKIPGGAEMKFSPLDADKLKAAGADVLAKEGPSLLADGAILVTGQIPRVTDFEFGLPIQYAMVDGVEEPDPLTLDDQALVVLVRGKGLVVISGCAHAGIVNTIAYARELTGVEEVHAIIGGFHLGGPLYESIIEPTVAAIEEFGPDFLLPTHCTGWKAIHELARRMPEAYVQNSVGTSLILGA